MLTSGGSRGSLAVLPLAEVRHWAQAVWMTVTDCHLFLSREEESKEESAPYPTAVVSPGLGDHGKTD